MPYVAAAKGLSVVAFARQVASFYLPDTQL
jgi:hypothetical protein